MSKELKKMKRWLMPEFERAVDEMWGIAPHGLHLFDIVGDGKDFSIAIAVFPKGRSGQVIDALKPILEQDL